MNRERFKDPPHSHPSLCSYHGNKVEETNARLISSNVSNLLEGSELNARRVPSIAALWRKNRYQLLELDMKSSSGQGAAYRVEEVPGDKNHEDDFLKLLGALDV